MLTVEAGQRLTGGEAELPPEAPGRITHLADVELLAHTGLVKRASVYRSSLIPVGNTGGLEVQAASLNLPSVLGTGLARGAWLNAGTARAPVAVLGAVAADGIGTYAEIVSALPGWLAALPDGVDPAAAATSNGSESAIANRFRTGATTRSA